MGVKDAHIKVGAFEASSHSPFAAMSRRAPSVMFAVVPGRCSPEIGCKCGSMHTLLQTSVIAAFRSTQKAS